MDIDRFLRRELDRRNENNGRYSLRKFAEYLEVAPSTLSRLIAGKQAPSQETLVVLKRKLNYEPPRKASKSKARKRPPTLRFFRDVTENQTYRNLGFWHFAIMDLSTTAGFKPDASWIAERLSTSASVMATYLNELLERKILIQGKNGKWELDNRRTTMTPTRETIVEAYRASAERVLLDLPDPARTGGRQKCGTCTLVMNPKHYEEVRVMVDKFVADVAVFAEADLKPEGAEIFHLNVAFFPLSKIKDN